MRHWNWGCIGAIAYCLFVDCALCLLLAKAVAGW